VAGLGANGTRRIVITAFFAGTAVIPVAFLPTVFVAVAGRRTVVAFDGAGAADTAFLITSDAGSSLGTLILKLLFANGTLDVIA
jgi:hypothetical protein